MDFKRYEPENFNAILPHENGRFMLVADHKAAMRDQDDHSKAMATDYEKQIAALKDTWKCFHCGFETTSRKEAEAHFGDGEGEPTMCIFWLTMPDHERVHAYQELSVELENERADNQRQAEEIKRLTERCIELEKWSSEHGLFILDGRTKPLKQEVKGIDYPSDHETVMFIKTETSFKPLKQP